MGPAGNVARRPDDAIWLVLEGHASFFGESGRPLGELGPHEGILVPALASYRFRCTGASLMARFGTGQLVTFLVDASGAARSIVLERYERTGYGVLSLTFANGNYQIASLVADTVDAFTLSPAGDVLARYRFKANALPADARQIIGFDGRRVVVLQFVSTALSVMSRDVSGRNEIRDGLTLTALLWHFMREPSPRA